ncbi:HpcH/HpaI aldolase/citrate lyase family protein [Actinomadura sp. CNU-125]|uniref:HpcH/HpaI aldolase/citrate lyase family protein n=1 Tax=Actinomadura sp. CNU-125 TaxID=1904961 RepID=UPI000AAEF8A1|nr:aldolase/citrate lyase family protein [Actinomadura sp. CNU-125]
MIPRTWLYVPGDRPDRIAKALGSDADTVILDLEDAVAPAAKADARRHRRRRPRRPRRRTPGARADQRARDARERRRRHRPRRGRRRRRPGSLAGVRIPKCEDPDELRRVADDAGRARPAGRRVRPRRRAGVRPGHRAPAGRGDLARRGRPVGRPARGRAALAWPRSRIVVAARAAGLPSPPQSVWTAVRDLDGLAADTRTGQRAGFFGRSVIHPAQIPVVHDACAPDPSDVAWARDLMDRLAERGEAAWIDSTGRFVDKAVVERATGILEAAQAAAGTAPKEGTRS